MYEKILVPLDGSDFAEKALDHAIKLANAFNSDLFLVQVVMTPIAVAVPYDISYQYNEEFRETAMNEAYKYLNSISARLHDDFGTRLHTKVIEGNVVESLLDYSNFQSIDLIVMATHGRSGFSRWVFGSVAESMLRAADCPIFLVRAKTASKSEKPDA
jgi:nucleotide-binding universal stress UspA family protein